MFSQKKKRSKGLLFLLPVLGIFLAGLWLNSFMNSEPDELPDEDRTVSAGYSEDAGKESNEIPIYEYTDNTDDAEIPSEDTDENYSGYRIMSEDDRLVIIKYVSGDVVSEEQTEIETDILPEYDREQLAEGIDISSESELEELLQDYEG
jgi:hypothetical protein